MTLLSWFTTASSFTLKNNGGVLLRRTSFTRRRDAQERNRLNQTHCQIPEKSKGVMLQSSSLLMTPSSCRIFERRQYLMPKAKIPALDYSSDLNAQMAPGNVPRNTEISRRHLGKQSILRDESMTIAEPNPVLESGSPGFKVRGFSCVGADTQFCLLARGIEANPRQPNQGLVNAAVQPQPV